MGEFSKDEEYDLDQENLDIPDYVTPDYDPVEPDSRCQKLMNGIQKQTSEILGQVFARKCDCEGNPIGMANVNPILDTQVYQVMFPEGNVAEYSANVIAECLYSQVDDEGRQYLLLD